MVSWSTDMINERERFAFWREMICNTLFSISPEAPSERFSARITVRNSGSLRFATCESTSYEIIRTARDIDRAPSDHYTIYLQLRGQTLINQGNESVAFNRNDFVLSDCRRPFRATLSNDGYRAIAVVPRALVNSRAPWLRRRPIHRLASNSRFLDLARHHMVRLVSNDLSEKEFERIDRKSLQLVGARQCSRHAAKSCAGGTAARSAARLLPAKLPPPGAVSAFNSRTFWHLGTHTASAL